MAEKGSKRKVKAKRSKQSVLGNLPASRPQRLGRPRSDTPAAPAPAAPPPPAKREAPRRPAAAPARVQASPASGRAKRATATEASAPATTHGAAAKPAGGTVAPASAEATTHGAAAKPGGGTVAPAPAKASRAAATPARETAKAASPRLAAPAVKPVEAKPSKPARRRAAKPAAAKPRPVPPHAPAEPPLKPEVVPTAADEEVRHRPSRPSRQRSGAAPPRHGSDGGPAAVRPGARPLPPHQRAGNLPPERTVHPPRGTELVTTAIQAAGELAQIGLSAYGRALKRAVDRLPRP